MDRQEKCFLKRLAKNIAKDDPSATDVTIRTHFHAILDSIPNGELRQKVVEHKKKHVQVLIRLVRKAVSKAERARTVRQRNGVSGGRSHSSKTAQKAVQDRHATPGSAQLLPQSTGGVLGRCSAVLIGGQIVHLLQMRGFNEEVGNQIEKLWSQVDDPAGQAEFSGLDRHCFMLMMTDGCADINTFYNVLAHCFRVQNNDMKRIQTISSSKSMAESAREKLTPLCKFLKMCILRRQRYTENKTVKPTIADYMIGLLSLYLDLFVIVYREAELTVGTQRRMIQLAKQVTSGSGEKSLDAVLQMSITEHNTAYFCPLLRYLLREKPEGRRSYSHYLRYLLTASKWKHLSGDLQNIMQEVRLLRAPKGFVDWVRRWNTEAFSLLPSDRKFKGRMVTRFLLDEADDEVISALMKTLLLYERGMVVASETDEMDTDHRDEPTQQVISHISSNEGKRTKKKKTVKIDVGEKQGSDDDNNEAFVTVVNEESDTEQHRDTTNDGVMHTYGLSNNNDNVEVFDLTNLEQSETSVIASGSADLFVIDRGGKHPSNTVSADAAVPPAKKNKKKKNEKSESYIEVQKPEQVIFFMDHRPKAKKGLEESSQECKSTGKEMKRKRKVVGSDDRGDGHDREKERLPESPTALNTSREKPEKQKKKKKKRKEKEVGSNEREGIADETHKEILADSASLQDIPMEESDRKKRKKKQASATVSESCRSSAVSSPSVVEVIVIDNVLDDDVCAVETRQPVLASDTQPTKEPHSTKKKKEAILMIELSPSSDELSTESADFFIDRVERNLPSPLTEQPKKKKKEVGLIQELPTATEDMAQTANFFIDQGVGNVSSLPLEQPRKKIKRGPEKVRESPCAPENNLLDGLQISDDMKKSNNLGMSVEGVTRKTEASAQARQRAAWGKEGGGERKKKRKTEDDIATPQTKSDGERTDRTIMLPGVISAASPGTEKPHLDEELDVYQVTPEENVSKKSTPVQNGSMRHTSKSPLSLEDSSATKQDSFTKRKTTDSSDVSPVTQSVCDIAWTISSRIENWSETSSSSSSPFPIASISATSVPVTTNVTKASKSPAEVKSPTEGNSPMKAADKANVNRTSPRLVGDVTDITSASVPSANAEDGTDLSSTSKSSTKVNSSTDVVDRTHINRNADTVQQILGSGDDNGALDRKCPLRDESFVPESVSDVSIEGDLMVPDLRAHLKGQSPNIRESSSHDSLVSPVFVSSTIYGGVPGATGKSPAGAALSTAEKCPTLTRPEGSPGLTRRHRTASSEDAVQESAEKKRGKKKRSSVEAESMGVEGMVKNSPVEMARRKSLTEDICETEKLIAVDRSKSPADKVRKRSLVTEMQAETDQQLLSVNTARTPQDANPLKTKIPRSTTPIDSDPSNSKRPKSTIPLDSDPSKSRSPKSTTPQDSDPSKPRSPKSTTPRDSDPSKSKRPKSTTPRDSDPSKSRSPKSTTPRDSDPIKARTPKSSTPLSRRTRAQRRSTAPANSECQPTLFARAKSTVRDKDMETDSTRSATKAAQDTRVNSDTARSRSLRSRTVAPPEEKDDNVVFHMKPSSVRGRAASSSSSSGALYSSVRKVTRRSMGTKLMSENHEQKHEQEWEETEPEEERHETQTYTNTDFTKLKMPGRKAASETPAAASAGYSSLKTLQTAEAERGARKRGKTVRDTPLRKPSSSSSSSPGKSPDWQMCSQTLTGYNLRRSVKKDH